MREQTLTRIEHPNFLLNGWQRVDHPDLRKLTDGDPTLRWAGDPRLVVYKNDKAFVLHRLEHDNQYRMVCVIHGTLGVETINRLITRLVEIDNRNGWNALNHLEKFEQKRDRDVFNRRVDFIHDFSDKFHFALSRSHIPGLFVTRIRNAPTPMRLRNG